MFETITQRRPLSLGFRCALFGIAMTIVARLTPWLWPGWPARTVLDFALARFAPSVAGPVEKGLGVIALLFVNVAFWGMAAWVAVSTWTIARKRLRR